MQQRENLICRLAGSSAASRFFLRGQGTQHEIRDIISGMILVVSGEKQERENSDKPGRREWLRSGISAIILHFISRFALEKKTFFVII